VNKIKKGLFANKKEISKGATSKDFISIEIVVYELVY